MVSVSLPKLAIHSTMPSDTDGSRELGIEMSDLLSALAADSFPMSKAELLAVYGDCELGYPNGETVSVESVLGPAGVETFRSVDDLRETMYHMVGGDAVGQRGQTGRGTSGRTPPESQRPPGKPGTEEETESTF